MCIPTSFRTVTHAQQRRLGASWLRDGRKSLIGVGFGMVQEARRGSTGVRIGSDGPLRRRKQDGAGEGQRRARPVVQRTALSHRLGQRQQGMQRYLRLYLI